MGKAFWGNRLAAVRASLGCAAEFNETPQNPSDSNETQHNTVPNTVPRREKARAKRRTRKPSAKTKRRAFRFNGERGLIYFIRCQTTGLIKIGWTGYSAAARMGALQVGSPTRLELVGQIRGDTDLEARLHSQFAPDLSHGEWFRPSEALVAFVRSVVGQTEDSAISRDELREALESA